MPVPLFQQAASTGMRRTLRVRVAEGWTQPRPPDTHAGKMCHAPDAIDALNLYNTRLKVSGSRTRESSWLLRQNSQKSHDFCYDRNRSISTA